MSTGLFVLVIIILVFCVFAAIMKWSERRSTWVECPNCHTHTNVLTGAGVCQECTEKGTYYKTPIPE